MADLWSVVECDDFRGQRVRLRVDGVGNDHGDAVAVQVARASAMGSAMFDRFSDDGRAVVVWAQEESRLLRHQEIGTEHLLLGVLHTDDPAVHTAVGAVGVHLDAVRDRVVELTGRRRREPKGHVPFTSSANQVMERSLQLSRQFGGRTVGPAHLLVAILGTPDCSAVRALLGLGVDVEDLAVAVRTAASGREE